MNFSLFIAKRYLLTRKSHHAINIISGVSVCGVAIATAALVCILSVFNGFRDMVAGLFTSFDPELKIVPAEGKQMAADEPELVALHDNPFITVYTEALEDNAMAVLNNRQVMVSVKGVDDSFSDLVDIDRIRFGEGEFRLHADVLDYGVFGVGVLSSLGVGADFVSPIQIYAPRGGEHIDLNDPTESFNQEELYSPKMAFSVRQQKYDANYVITSISFARRLFERQGYVSAVELKLSDGCDADDVKAALQSELGDKYRVLNRYEQQEDTFRIMKIEKLMSYIFLTFILMVACFNIIGSLSMLIIEKKQDVVILRNLGADRKQISGIFMSEGRMISALGAVAGILLGLTLCLIQQYYGVIKFGHSAGSYIIDAYPVSVHFVDIIIIFITVLAVGFLSVWYPVTHLSRKILSSSSFSSIAVFLCAFAMTSCSSGGTGFRIKGTIDGMKGGTLYMYNLSSSDARLDTITINEEGSFVYKGNAVEPTPFILTFENGMEQVIFADGGQDLGYTASNNDLKNYVIDGNEDNDLMNQFRLDTRDLKDQAVIGKAGEYIRKYAETATAAYLFDRYFVQNEYAVADSLRQMLKILRKAQPDNRYLKKVQARMKYVTRGDVGSEMPDITVTTKQKKKIRLRDDAADFTLIVYWASWMDRQYEFMESLYTLKKQMDADGKDNIRFVAISLDTEIYRWEDFIRQDSLTVSHCCDGFSWETPAAKKMGVCILPYYIILDKSHKVIARGTERDAMSKDIRKYAK